MSRRGFTLIEVVIAIGIIGILAAGILPVVAGQITRGRDEATEKELGRIREALLAYYEDIGAFPSEGQGLPALVSDTGHPDWRGPYIAWGQGDSEEAIRSDQFGEDYVYDLSPSTDPAGVADLIVLSTGANRINDLMNGGAWELDRLHELDDMAVILAAAAMNRDKRERSIVELNELADAARAYYRENGGFPDHLDSLAGSYIDVGIDGAALVDGWGNDYHLSLSGGPSPVLELWSSGPDQADDSTGGDDIWLEVNSGALEAENLTSPPGNAEDAPEDGSFTEYLVATAQAAIDANPGVIGWSLVLENYLDDLGLGDRFAEDDWGEPLMLKILSDVVYSSGPDRNMWTENDNIPVGVGPFGW